jgi:hypothetical protein
MKWNEMRTFPGPFATGFNGGGGKAPTMAKVEVVIITFGRPHGAHSSVAR